MLHLNVVRADAACATHETSATHDMPAQHDMAAMDMSHDVNVSDVVIDDASCETPVHKDCCQAMTSCAPLVGSAVESPTATPEPSHDAVGAPFATRPFSRSCAPEPPPPRL